MIGRYKLLEQIGEGGFGVVYMAEQLEPVKRHVALKIIKAGMDSKEVIARFEAERQALALMDHPNIAKVFDGGVIGAGARLSPAAARPTIAERSDESGHEVTDGLAATEDSRAPNQRAAAEDSHALIAVGRPYFVMELVRGIPITKFCDQRCLDTAARLQLFMQVCKAVQHAHQKGIIHRDLKPSNILVTHHESEPMPKIIDFGVAKALGQKLTDKTLFTGFLRMVGTPAYMSPEQAEFTGMDIDTRSDIYSLGVLLYELLTGVTPFDPETIRNAALDELRRMIRETEPSKPSTRLQTLGERLDGIARQRHTEALKLIHRVRGDLDWIVMKCLEKDRRRRYETVNGLAMDIQRHLDNEPVVARPPSKLYEFQKTVRRHKFGFAAAGAITTALAVGLTISLASLLRERAARLRAELAEQLAEVAVHQKQEQLWASQVIEARYHRTGGQAGQRIKALNVIREAANWKPSIELRNEAMAALLLPDFGTNTWFHEDSNAAFYFAFDPEFAHYSDQFARPVRVRRTQDNTVVASLTPLSGYHHWLRFSPDGRLLASLEAGRTPAESRVVFWDWRNERELLVVPNGLGYVSRPVFDFTPDSREILVATREGPVRRFDAETVQELQPPLLSMPSEAICLSPSGEAAAVYIDGEVQVWNLTRSQQVARCSLPKPMTGIAWHPHEEMLAIGTLGAGLFLWNLDGKRPRPISDPKYITYVLFSPYGDLVVAGAWFDDFGIWDAATGRLLLSNRDGALVALNREGSLVAYTRERIGCGVRQMLWPKGLRRLALPHSIADDYGALDAGFHPESRWLLSAHVNGWLMWDTASARIVGRNSGGRVDTVTFLPDGHSFVTSGSAGVQQWPFKIGTAGRPEVGPPQQILSPKEFPFLRIVLSPDGEWFIGVSVGGASLLYRLDDATITYLAGSETRPAVHADITRDGRWVVMGHTHGSRLHVYELPSGKHVCDLPSGEGWGLFHPHKPLLLGTGTRDYALWQTGTWELVRRLPRESGDFAFGISAFSPDGRYYLVNDGETHLRLRDAETHEDFATLLFPDAHAQVVRFDPTGNRFVGIGSQPTLFLWDLTELRRELGHLGLDWLDKNPSAGFAGE